MDMIAQITAQTPAGDWQVWGQVDNEDDLAAQRKLARRRGFTGTQWFPVCADCGTQTTVCRCQ